MACSEDPCAAIYTASASGEPSWAKSLKLTAKSYYEGVVNDAEALMTEHCNATVTTYGTRTSRKMQVSPICCPQ